MGLHYTTNPQQELRNLIFVRCENVGMHHLIKHKSLPWAYNEVRLYLLAFEVVRVGRSSTMHCGQLPVLRTKIYPVNAYIAHTSVQLHFSAHSLLNMCNWRRSAVRLITFLGHARLDR